MDNDIVKATTPWWFWLVSGLILLWNLSGVANYLSSVTATPESLAAQDFTPEQIEFMLAMPAYYAAVFALAIWSGVLGAILLLLRKKLAVPVLMFTALMVVISFGMDALGGTFTMLGGAYIAIMIIVLVISLFAVWFARSMRARGIVR
ncbi:hypothetical protein [Fretibacter rubidus]|uniref:hypothetical protein n=1 Tax=Fretibacter rubidus TaxID=570162 RepID=UPI00352AE054